MELLIDIGNTTVAVYEADKSLGTIGRCYRLPTNPNEDYSALMSRKRENGQAESCIICSVVPEITGKVSNAVTEVYGIEPVILRRENIPMPVTVDEPDKVGMDRLVDAYYAYSEGCLPAVTVDLGTATTIGVVTVEDGFIGGSISAGVGTGLHAIGNKGAQLFSTDITLPKSPIGKNTAECLNIGAVCGAAAMIDGMMGLIENETGCEMSLIITGGYASYVGKYVRHVHRIEENMLAKSLLLLSKEL